LFDLFESYNDAQICELQIKISGENFVIKARILLGSKNFENLGSSVAL
jgi:hypothetical protein